ncbi:MAG: Gfo/Idh/MocA family oxidoreductase [Kangiellaceae bacterium]|nr:Gfo/Idh/MocA family oxidoreductase [Kangiellaceae bacterium]MCW9018186.1 Gfo/Idh/MocA family oxidoreductase [Kangiellaceae bacterium]
MILVVGAGYMAREYVRVLKALEQKVLVVGRGESKVKEIREEFNVEAVSGGLELFIKNNSNSAATHAIVCTPVETLSKVTLSLLKYGVKRILLEKPGGGSKEELEQIGKQASESEAEVYIGYNRRFYQSTIEAEKIIKSDGGLTGLSFEITEWSHVIENENVSDIVKQNWMIANTSHVIDLAFHIAGAPLNFSTYSSGKLDWHNSGSRFCGAGITESNTVFNYCGFWDGPGRWSIDFVTRKNRLIFKPMEKLQIQRVGSVAVEMLDNVDYDLDESFKPGLYLQTSAFLARDYSKLCSIEEQLKALSLYEKIANYQ